MKTPEDYGAVGDGVTDDTSAVQSAFNSGSVELRYWYKITNKLTAPSGLRVQGPGIIDKGTMLAADRLGHIYCDGASDVILDGVRFASSLNSPQEGCVYLADTSTPCNGIQLLNCKSVNSNLIYSAQNLHLAGSGYPYSYYSDSSKLHRRITMLGNEVTHPIGAPSGGSYAFWLFWCQNVICQHNQVDGCYGLFSAYGGDPGDPYWLASKQYSHNINVGNNNLTNVYNGVVLVGCRNAMVGKNVIESGSTASEIFDSEGGRDITFVRNTVYGGQRVFVLHRTNNNVKFIGNQATVDTYTPDAGSTTGVFENNAVLSDPDIANSGKVSFSGNTIVSAVNNQWMNVGACKEMSMDGNDLTNVTIYSMVGTNVLDIMQNKMRFSQTPTYKPIIQIGNYRVSPWDSAACDDVPKARVHGNVITKQKSGSLNVGAIRIGKAISHSVVEVKRNTLGVTDSGVGVYLEDGQGVVRDISIHNNVMNRGIPFTAENVSSTSDSLSWKDNNSPTGQDVMGAVTGTEQAKLTVTAKPILVNGTRIWNQDVGDAGLNAGWVYNRDNQTWQTF